MPHKILTLATTGLLALLTCCTTLLAEVDSGTAAQVPWSGYWWKHQDGGLTGPLSKYDQVASSSAAAWEQSNHVQTATGDWFGHCHAWSAASISEREPTQGRTVENVGFGVGDLKGLLCAIHGQDVANSWGDRYGDGVGNEDRLDLAPDELWRLLQMYVRQRQLPIVLDFEAGEQVWNYPVYRYQVDYNDAGDGWVDARLYLEAADDGVDESFVGTHPYQQNYTFRARFQDGALVMGSGAWTGASVEDHPDFAWYPYVAVAENPEVDLETVAMIVGSPVGGDNPPADDGTPTEGPELDPPTTGEEPPVDDVQQPPVLASVELQDFLNADELIALITNKTSSFALDAFTDKGDGGRYEVGDPITVSLRSAEAGYLYLFDVGPKGELSLVFPLPGHPNRIEKDTLYDIPWKGEPRWFTAATPGQHDLKAIVTTKPLRITGFKLISHEANGDYEKPDTKQFTQQQNTNQKQKPPQPPIQQQKINGQQRQTQAQQYQPQVQTFSVYPTQRRRIFWRLGRAFGKGTAEDPEPVVQQEVPQKISGFAQDMVSYFVLTPAKQKQKPKPDQGASQDQRQNQKQKQKQD